MKKYICDICKGEFDVGIKDGSFATEFVLYNEKDASLNRERVLNIFAGPTYDNSREGDYCLNCLCMILERKI